MFPTPEALVEKLVKLRSGLIALKQDRTTYVKSSNVVRLYDELCEYLQQAQTLEKGILNGPRESGSKRKEIFRFVPATVFYHANSFYFSY